MKSKLLKALDLQLFADDGADPAPEAAPEAAAEEKDAEPEKKYTDEDVDRIISQKFASWEKKQQKAVDEAKKLAEMNAQQKAEYERDQLKAELDELKAAKTKHDLSRTARAILSEEGISITDELLDVVVGRDADATKTQVDSFVKMYKEAVQQGIAEALKGSAPKAGGDSKLSKAEILAVKNTRERQRLINENIELFR